jgi:S1-C subfamily serine protease
VVDNRGGARVERVVATGPAAGAGIGVGDVITAVDGVPVTSATAMADVLVPHHPGDTIAVTLRTKTGETRTVNVVLGDGPPA